MDGQRDGPFPQLGSSAYASLAVSHRKQQGNRSDGRREISGDD